MQNRQKTKNKGFVALVSVIVLSAIAILVVVSNISMNTDRMINTKVSMDGLKAKSAADSCVEVGISRLKDNLTYGGESLTIGTCSCLITAPTGSGLTNRSFQTTGTCGTVVRKMSVTLSTVNPNAVVSVWKEIP